MKKGTHQITSIQPQKRKNRVNVFLDGSFAFGLEREVALEHQLSEGEKISDARIEKILYAENKKRAKTKVLDYLNYRARSIKEIRDKLREKEIPRKIIAEVIEDFTRVGLLDDEKFAAVFVRSRMVKKKVSKRYLLMELKDKGIPEGKARLIIEENYGEQSEYEVACELLKKKLGRGDLSHDKIKKRVTDFLHRRGFDWEVIWEVVSHHKDKEQNFRT